MKKQVFLLLIIILLHLSAGLSFAARNLEITSDKSSIFKNEELNIVASVSGFVSSEKIYLKGAFYKDGSSNYFGLTKFNDSWIKNSTTALSQKEVIIDSWDNNILVKPDFNDSGFSGSGEYKFKVGFYYLTSSGNLSSVNWSNDINIKIEAIPTETPTPSKIKNVNSSSSFSLSNTQAINKTPTSMKIITPSISKTIISEKNSKSVSEIKNNKEFAKISVRQKSASEYAQIKPITNIENKKEKVKVLGSNNENFIPILFLSGLAFLLAGISFFIINELRNRNIL